VKSTYQILLVVFVGLAMRAAALAQSSAAFNLLSPPTAAGGLIYGIGTNVYGNLPVGPTGDCLESNGTTLAWAPCTLGTGFSFGGDLQGTSISQVVVGLEGRPVLGVAPSTGQALEWNGTAWAPATLAGFGTVSSVGLSLPSIFSVTSSPVTSSGTLAATLSNQGANLVFASPNGSTGAPAFRPLTGADVPAVSLSTTGNGGIMGTLGIANGGTGLSLVGGNGQCLTSNGTAIVWGACGTGTVTSVGLSLPGGFAASGSPVTGNGTLGISMPSGWGNGSLLIGNGANSVTTLPVGEAGQCLVSNGATAGWGGCSTALPPSTESPAAHQFLNSYNASTGTFTVAQPNFSDLAGTASLSQLPPFSFSGITGAIAATQLAPSPVTGDCPQYNGALLVWAACGGLPGSWTLSGNTNTVLTQPASAQDAVVQQWMPSVSNPSADILQAYLPGATPSTNCATNSKCAFAIQANGNLFMSGNSFSLGSVNQATASYLSLPGGTPGQAYLKLSSAALNAPTAPSLAVASGGSIPVGYSTPVTITYVNGGGETLTSGTSSAPATTSGNQEVVVTSPAAETNATGYNIYVQASGGNWYGPVNSSPVAIGTNYTISSIPSAGGLPSANTTGGIYNTYLSMSAEGSGILCSSSSVPGQDCASGTNLLTANNLMAGPNISITPGSNGNVTIASTGAGASVTLQTNGTSNGSQSLLNLVPGSNVTLTNSGGSVTIAASGGAVTTTHYIPLEACEPDQTGYSFYTVASQANWFEGHWEMVAGQPSAIYCRVRIPHTLASSSGANLVLTISANDSTPGHTANFQTCDNIISTTINVGTLSCATAQSFTTTATALAPVNLTFPVQSALAPDGFLVVKIAATAIGAAPAANMHVWSYLQITETE
jgi:hypothetical protein